MYIGTTNDNEQTIDNCILCDNEDFMNIMEEEKIVTCSDDPINEEICSLPIVSC